MSHLRGSKIFILEKKIDVKKKNKKSIILLLLIMRMMMISKLTPAPFTQAQLEPFIGLSMLVTCTKPWFCAHGFVRLFSMEY